MRKEMIMKAFALQLNHVAVTIAGSALPGPTVTYDPVSKQWQLDHAYTYLDNPHAITVPGGFVFDLASVPRIFWGVIAPFELSITAPLIHDFLYRHRGQPPVGAVVPPKTYARRDADVVFREIMEQEGVAKWRREVAYIAVRCFGGFAWS